MEPSALRELLTRVETDATARGWGRTVEQLRRVMDALAPEGKVIPVDFTARGV
ncbi:hypothetical protein NX862_01240 [Rhodobacter sp. KR11]|jgi:hypothetical protein|uniref:hypothetical protein n=1 Tax=Rhodobacter sp. KR11 TaxID=2974588 RepID=UPI002221E998|nr:hypothetical protein [Rhodobacter sp. KR11]MCW1917370.1 hypothetical protein [Rhodobacter sp. KR11]